MKKKSFQVLLAAAALVLIPLSFGKGDVAQAATNSNITLNGTPLTFTDVQPAVIHDRTYVPFRALLESLGSTVTWDQATNEAVAVKDGLTLRIPIGGSVLNMQGHQLSMDVASTVINDRTMVPLRYVSQALGATVKWSPENGGQITITQGPTDMVDQLTSGQSGDQKVTYEQAGILFEWLKAHQSSLPAFTGPNGTTGLNSPFTFFYSDDSDVAALLQQVYKAYPNVDSIVTSPREHDLVETGPYRIEKLQSIDPQGKVIFTAYSVWDATKKKHYYDAAPGSELMHYIPDHINQ